MSIRSVNGAGGIDFDRKGGLCCNFNPVRTCCIPPPSIYFVSRDNVLVYDEEPGLGLCMCIVLLIMPIPVIFPCYVQGGVPPWLYCGMGSPVNYSGVSFSAVNGTVQCKINTKHCYTQDPDVLLTDVLDIGQVDCRTQMFHFKHSKSIELTFHALEIVYCNEAGHLMRHRTAELVSPVDHTPFLDAVKQFIRTYRTKESRPVPVASLEMVDRGFDSLAPVPLVVVPAVAVPVQQDRINNNKITVAPVPQPIMARGHVSVHPSTEESEMY